MPKIVTRVYRPYYEWEDYQNGMYRVVRKKKEAFYVEKAKRLLARPELFYQVGLCLLEDWPVATESNLTNISGNRRAWLGQASCCYMYKVPELQTREAWKQLSDEQRGQANAIADRVIIVYEQARHEKED